MSLKYDIEFRVSNDPRLTPEQRKLAKEYGHYLFDSSRKYKDFAYFTFIILKQHFYSITQREKIRELYAKRMVIGRSMSSFEDKFCAKLANSYDIAKANNNFEKFISSIFEYYAEAHMQLLHGHEIIMSCNALIDKKKIEFNDVRTIDLAIDKLDEVKMLILAECCLTLQGLQKKGDQIEFYARLLKIVRDKVDKSNLQFEMIVADNGTKHWSNIDFASFSLLHNNGIIIYGRTLISEEMTYHFEPN
jgi:hypothetical protein